MNLQEQISRIKNIMGINEGLHDTAWEANGHKITLSDLLDATKDVPVQDIDIEELKPHLLDWNGDEEEMKKVDKADLTYPILIFVDDNGGFISIIDGHHRAQKAVKNGLKTISGKKITLSSLPKDIRKVFSHMENGDPCKDKRFSNMNMEFERSKLDINKLVSVGALFVTKSVGGDPKDKETYKKVIEGQGNSIISLLNYECDSPDGWIRYAVDNHRTEPTPQDQNLLDNTYEGKYNQILWSLEKLGIDIKDVMVSHSTSNHPEKNTEE